MSLPDVPKHLHAMEMVKSYKTDYHQRLLKFYNKCLKEIENGEHSCSVNSEDIDKSIRKDVQSKLEAAGYDVEDSFDLFSIKNPNIPCNKSYCCETQKKRKL